MDDDLVPHRNRIEPHQPVMGTLRAAQVSAVRSGVEAVRDALTRGDSRGRHLSLAITHLEDAETRLLAADEMVG